MQFHTQIEVTPETVFDLITDFGNYAQWLPPSNTFRQVSPKTEPKVMLGSIYRDRGPLSVMTGKVIACEPPNHIAFDQQTSSPLGALGVQIDYRLTATPSGTEVQREVIVTTRGVFRLIEAPLFSAIRKENLRILAKMKAYLEGR